MTPPRKAGSLLKPTAILERMEPNTTYKVFEIAARTRTSAAAIRPMLAEMVARGQLERIDLGERTPGFRRPPGQKAAAIEEKISARVAQPRTFARLTGTLVGYDAEITRRGELCMMVRTQ
jgi:hypothetical protein